jgi:hypothetical protein
VTEDSGAFKTNPRNQAQIGRFVIRSLPGKARIGAGFERQSRRIAGRIIGRFSDPRPAANYCILDSA